MDAIDRHKLKMWMLTDVKALNIHRQMDVKLNELAKQILMLLPLLLFFSFFIFLGGGKPPRKIKMKKTAAEAAASKSVLPIHSA